MLPPLHDVIPQPAQGILFGWGAKPLLLLNRRLTLVTQRRLIRQRGIRRGKKPLLGRWDDRNLLQKSG